MKKSLLRILITLVILFSTTQITYSNESMDINKLSDIQIAKNLTSMSLSFTENQGQWDKKVQFRANAGGATMWFASDGAYYQFTRTIKSDDGLSTSPSAAGQVSPRPDITSGRQMPSSAPDVTLSGVEGLHHDSLETMMIKANFVGANQNPQMIGVDELENKCNYFIGNDKSKWATDIPNYSAVMYENIYDGIDLKYYGNSKQIEYDFIVSPGADFSQIKIQYEGTEAVAVNDDGELVVTTKWGKVIEQCPVVYQIDNNSRIAVNGSYKIIGASSFSFALSDYNPSLPLVIDPVLTYSTYLGGSGNETGYGIAVDASGSAYITGNTNSTDFPSLNSYTGVLPGSVAIFITKLSSSGNSLVYSTYLGGTGDSEVGFDIAVDASGMVYVVGRTNSTDFPTLNPYQGTFQGGLFDAFITKLNSTGDSLIYSTYLGGSDQDHGGSITVGASGVAYIVGSTNSTDFPTVKPYIATAQGGVDVFVTKLSSGGDSLLYSTYLGGSSDDYGSKFSGGGLICGGIAVDVSTAVYVTGSTNSTDFPTLNPYQGTYQGGFTDAFVTKLNSSGNSLIYSTYLGGSSDEYGCGIAVDAYGSAYVTGTTGSTNFPTLNPYIGTHQGGVDGFVTKFNAAGDSLVYSTFLGGTGIDYGRDIAIDASRSVYITGTTSSADFPMLDPYQGTFQGGGYGDAYVTKLNFAGNSLIYSTYLGGSAVDEANAIAVDTSGAAYVTGYTRSTDFPTLNPYQGTFQGVYFDVFVTKFAPVATDIQEYDFGNLPSDFVMSQNYPNPFNPTTTIEFNLPTKSNVTINIYNLLGQKIQQLVHQEYSAGNYQVTWDGTSTDGVQVSTGIYLYRIETDSFVKTKKMLLLK